MQLYVEHAYKNSKQNSVLPFTNHNCVFFLFHKRPPVVKVDQAIALSDLRRLLPKTVFDTDLCGEGVVSENIFATMIAFGVVVIN